MQTIATEMPVAPVAYSIRDAARAAGLSERALFYSWSAGDGPRRKKVQGRIVILADDLRDWLASKPDG